MTWYQRKSAVNTETGEQHSVVVPLSDDSLYPTMFFTYFSNAPIHNVITQCLDVLDLTEFLSDIQKEEAQKGITNMQNPAGI